MKKMCQMSQEEEEKVKQPTRSEVNAALETLTKYSLFVVDGGEEIWIWSIKYKNIARQLINKYRF